MPSVRLSLSYASVGDLSELELLPETHLHKTGKVRGIHAVSRRIELEHNDERLLRRVLSQFIKNVYINLFITFVKCQKSEI